jgi:hypothetical protein
MRTEQLPTHPSQHGTRPQATEAIHGAMAHIQGQLEAEMKQRVAHERRGPAANPWPLHVAVQHGVELGKGRYQRLNLYKPRGPLLTTGTLAAERAAGRIFVDDARPAARRAASADRSRRSSRASEVMVAAGESVLSADIHLNVLNSSCDRMYI